jgi:glucose/arabinose dehydrogenase
LRPRALVALVALVAIAAGSAGAAPQPPGKARGGVKLVPVGRFDTPTYVAGAPGFPRLLFVTEQPGRVRVVRHGHKRRRPFLDIRGLVNFNYEQGLFSVAFHPGYKRNRLFYVFYVDNAGNIRIDEFKRRNRLRAARGSRRPVMRIVHQPYTTHMGGQLQFLGRFLYISTGDGGGVGDPGDDAKDRRSLLGKLLRIDPRNPRGRARHRVPRTNPFVGRRGRDQIFAYGLRNPWRFSFDRTTARRSRIVIPDVGQERFEEVNYETLRSARGGFFGWDEFEGFAPYECDGACARHRVKPVYTYGRNRGCTIIGGYVVRDRRLRSIFGRYVFSDLCTGRIHSFVPKLRRARGARFSGLRVSHPVSFGEDAAGHLYVTTLGGRVFRFKRRR